MDALCAWVGLIGVDTMMDVTSISTVSGKIHTYDYQDLEFFNRFTKLDPEYEEVAIGTHHHPMETKSSKRTQVPSKLSEAGLWTSP